MSFYSLNERRQASRPIPQIQEAPVVTVIPVCNNPLLRLGLEQLLSDSHFVVWQDSVDNPANLSGFPDGSPALFIIDGNAQPDGAADLVRRLKAYAPTGRVVILADHFEPGQVAAAWNAGADGFCLSTIGHDALIRTLELIMLGESYLPSELALTIMARLTGQAEHRFAGDLWGLSEADLKSKKLSSREAEILICLKEGASNKVIARMLKLSDATVKVHVKTILRKIGVSNRTQAALWAAQHMALDAKPSAAELSTQ